MEKILSLPSLLDQAHQLSVDAEAAGEKSTAPSRVRAWRKWRRISSQITKLYEEVVRDLDAPTREIWDDLYRLFRAKMACEDLTVADYSEIEKHIYEKLPTENTDLIMKVAKIL